MSQERVLQLPTCDLGQRAEGGDVCSGQRRLEQPRQHHRQR